MHILRAIKNRLSNFNTGESLNFTCNICGSTNVTNLKKLSRERPSCTKCHSSVRMRAIVHLLSMELFGESYLLKDFPERKDIKGIGISDWEGYAKPLSGKLSYTNTFYHKEPLLDITAISEKKFEKYDFIISSEIYEHVKYPVSRAFENTYKLLKEDGVFIFTVPYTKEGSSTLEHFGKLNDYEILKENGEYVLYDVDETGKKKVFKDLIFHGGPGSTLEMRVFSEASLKDELRNAGFEKVKIYNEPFLKYGIFWDVDWSLPIAARK